MYQGRHGIGLAEAGRLVQEEGWIARSELINLATQTSVALMEAKPRERIRPEAQQALQSLMEQLHKETWGESDSLEVYMQEDRVNPMMRFRVGPGRIFRMGEAAKKSLSTVLGLLFFSATTGASGGLLMAGYALFGWPILQHIRESLVSITDPDELQVFEAVAALSAEICVVDAEALRKEDFTAAYDQRAPFREDIVNQLSGKVSPHVIDKCLAALSQRNILVSDEERWRIVF